MAVGFRVLQAAVAKEDLHLSGDGAALTATADVVVLSLVRNHMVMIRIMDGHGAVDNDVNYVRGVS